MTALEPSGIVLLNKPPGLTSFQSLDAVKKFFSTSKVGHAGTLDKFASGLLLVLVGRAVKLTPWVSGCDKHYEGIIRFGVETDTLDPEGVPVARGDIPSREVLEEVLPRFRGDIFQAPPAYSAIHLGGKRASQRVRDGEPVEMEKRPVTVYALDLLSYEPPVASVHVHCSKGTYIRSLARDVALAAGSRGHLQALTRTQAAGFYLSQALEFSSLSPGKEPSPRVLTPLEPEAFEALGIPVVFTDTSTAESISRGIPLDRLIREKRVIPPPDSRIAVAGLFRSGACAGRDGDFLGIIEEKTAGVWSYGYVYARS
ncbi:MAG: tRNA pseudouridine(55) synthase TruB [Spirochaetaceae bacterium]|jgi:tRNA pseudouridine55 synthase|nr:tRNA pseudouridine(55) synthase TruB [Spirochaetaceae bacterium]